MSTILKALRRLEEERAARGRELPLEQELARSEGAEIVGRRRRRAVVLGLAGVGALAVAGLVIWGLASQEERGAPGPRLAARRAPPGPIEPARPPRAAPREEAIPGFEPPPVGRPDIPVRGPEAGPGAGLPAAQSEGWPVAERGEAAAGAPALPPAAGMAGPIVSPAAAPPRAGDPVSPGVGSAGRAGAPLAPAAEPPPSPLPARPEAPARAAEIPAIEPTPSGAGPAAERLGAAVALAERAEAPAEPPQAPTRTQAVSPTPRPAQEVAKSPAPPRRVARRPSPRPPAVRVARPVLPDLVVTRTVWHPDPARRSAVVELAGREKPLRLREGDAVGSLVIGEIEPAGVVFLHGGVEVRREVGRGR